MPDEHQKGFNKDYKNILEELDTYFNERIKCCIDKGIDKDRIIIDPGIGFGKSGHDNITILENIDFLQRIHNKICIGTSNKRYSSTLFNGIETKNDLKVANVASSALCALKGTTFLRVHDVGITREAILIVNKAKSV